jgi:hypothetical protein
VVSQRDGRWRQAIEAPGLGALNKGGNAKVVSVSCASAGCAAVGSYRNHGRRGFVVLKRRGRWGRAVQVPGLAALNTGGNAEASSVSCASPGYCAAVGFYTDGGGHRHGFVAVEQNGVWSRAVEVPGLAALNTGGNVGVSSVSCASPGNCAAGGYYATGAARRAQAFVVSEQNGSWGTAQQVAGNLTSGPGGDAFVDSVSCGSPGNCAAGGQYSASYSSGDQAFVISEVNGAWAAARAVAGTLSCCGGARVTSVSCASAGNCAAGRQFDYGGYNAAFLVNEKNGAWGKQMYVPGLNAVSRDAYLSSVSCASAGNCAAGGNYDLGGDRRARCPAGRGGPLGVVRLGGQLRGRRFLPGDRPGLRPPGVRHLIRASGPAVALRATGPRAGLDPGDLCAPSGRKPRAGPGLPRPARGPPRTRPPPDQVIPYPLDQPIPYPGGQAPHGSPLTTGGCQPDHQQQRTRVRNNVTDPLGN